jgi:hypothetical protein
MLRSWPTKMPNMNKIQQKTNDQLRTQRLGTDGRTRVFQYTHHSGSGGIIRLFIDNIVVKKKKLKFVSNFVSWWFSLGTGWQ